MNEKACIVSRHQVSALVFPPPAYPRGAANKTLQVRYKLKRALTYFQRNKRC